MEVIGVATIPVDGEMEEEIGVMVEILVTEMAVMEETGEEITITSEAAVGINKVSAVVQ